MALPVPTPGLVISYSYLWHREYVAGREEGSKDRPCAVIAAIRTDEVGDTRVLVLPITHKPPEPGDHAVQIPALTKSRLGLDEAASWIVLSEWNEFAWPGPDLRQRPRRGTFEYGMLPPRLFGTITAQFLDLLAENFAKGVRRTE